MKNSKKVKFQLLLNEVSFYFKRMPARFLYIVLLPTFLFFLYLSIFSPRVFESTMTISLDSASAGPVGIQGSIFPSFQGMSGANQSLEKVRLFLESREASEIIDKHIGLKALYEKDLSLRLLGKSNSFEDLHKFRVNHTNIDLNKEANTLEISSQTFKGKDAFRANLAMILAVNMYLDRNSQISSSINQANKICELSLLRNIDHKSMNASSNFNILDTDFSGANALITKISSDKAYNCRKILENSNGNLSFSDPLVNPTSNLLLDAYKNSLAQITASRLDEISSNETLEIVIEPNLPFNPISTNAFIISIAYFIVSSLIIYVYQIIMRLWYEFEI